MFWLHSIWEELFSSRYLFVGLEILLQWQNFRSPTIISTFSPSRRRSIYSLSSVRFPSCALYTTSRSIWEEVNFEICIFCCLMSVTCLEISSLKCVAILFLYQCYLSAIDILLFLYSPLMYHLLTMSLVSIWCHFSKDLSR